MRMRKAWIGTIGALALAALGTGDVQAAVAVVVTIEAAREPGEFVAAASVRDLSTDAIVAAPRIALRAGSTAESSLSAGPEAEPPVRFEVGIDATATRATWRLEWRRGGRIEALHEGSVTLAAPVDDAY